MNRASLTEKIVLLAVAAGVLCGCVSVQRYGELKKELGECKKQSEAVGNEAKLLKQKNEDLTRELQQLRQPVEYYFKTGMDHYNNKQYAKALEYFEKIVDRYPTDGLAPEARNKITELAAISSANYEKIVKAAEHAHDPRNRLEIVDREREARFLTKEDDARLLRKRDEYYDEWKYLDGAAKNILVEDDPTKSLRVYRTTRSTLRRAGNDKSFYFEIYIVQHYSGKKDFRLRSRYVGDKWISYDSLTLKGDNGTQADIYCKYPEKMSTMAEDRFFEWSDNDIEDDKVLKLAKSQTVSVLFNGGYKYSFELSDEQMLSLREIARKYQSLR